MKLKARMLNFDVQCRKSVFIGILTQHTPFIWPRASSGFGKPWYVCQTWHAHDLFLARESYSLESHFEYFIHVYDYLKYFSYKNTAEQLTTDLSSCKLFLFVLLNVRTFYQLG